MPVDVVRGKVAGLYLITPAADIGGEELARRCAAVLPFANVLQYRAQKPNLQTALLLAGLCREYDCLFIVNDDPRLAKDAGAGGVHLGVGDESVSSARKVLGADAVIGATCGDDINLAKLKIDEGADYCAFGAVYPSPTKPEKSLCALDVIVRAKDELHAPVVAIGGITQFNAAAIKESGADAVAVSSGVFAADNPAVAADNINRLVSPLRR